MKKLSFKKLSQEFAPIPVNELLEIRGGSGYISLDGGFYAVQDPLYYNWLLYDSGGTCLGAYNNLGGTVSNSGGLNYQVIFNTFGPASDIIGSGGEILSDTERFWHVGEAFKGLSNVLGALDMVNNSLDIARDIQSGNISINTLTKMASVIGYVSKNSVVGMAVNSFDVWKLIYTSAESLNWAPLYIDQYGNPVYDGGPSLNEIFGY